MSKTGKFTTHHIQDDGVWYTPGEIVRIDQSGRQIRIVKDVTGGYEVYSCRHATEYAGTPALLRIGLRKATTADPSAPVSLYGV
jgi:hypothetical protein